MSIQNNPGVGSVGGDFRSRSGALERTQRPVKGLNRTVSLEAGTKNIPSGEKPQGTSLAKRSVNVDTGLSIIAQGKQPQHLLSKEEVVAEAGPAKFGSKHFSNILTLTDQYHQTSESSPADKVDKLNNLKEKIENFIGSKAKAKGNKALKPEQQKRLAGLGKQLAAIKAECHEIACK